MNDTKPQPGKLIGLTFPLNADALFALNKGGFILAGKTTLASGTASVADRRIQLSSVAFLTYNTTDNALSSSGTLSAGIAQGTLTITSSDSSDASDVYYIVILGARVT
jgi:hypothetical protein